MEELSPRYLTNLITNIEKSIWENFQSYRNVLFYIQKWQKKDKNFIIEYRDVDKRQIDLPSTLHNIDNNTIFRIAMDLGIETPNFIPSMIDFKTEMGNEYPTASSTFNKAYKTVHDDPSLSIGLANSALESIIKNILKDRRIQTKWNENDTLYQLASKLLKEFRLFPNENMPSEIKTIGSSLLSASKAIEELRCNHSEFHGKTTGDYLISDPMYAYLCLNSICSIGLFLIAFYNKTYPKPKDNNDIENIYNELPF